MEILIFRTNVDTKKKVSRLKPLLTSVVAIKQWNFDLDDCDYVLRIETTGLNTNYVEALLQNAGFDCTELDY